MSNAKGTQAGVNILPSEARRGGPGGQEDRRDRAGSPFRAPASRPDRGWCYWEGAGGAGTPRAHAHYAGCNSNWGWRQREDNSVPLCSCRPPGGSPWGRREGVERPPSRCWQVGRAQGRGERTFMGKPPGTSAAPTSFLALPRHDPEPVQHQQ